MTAPLLRVSKAMILSPGGRPLFDDLNVSLSRERVALVGRNGVGKSTLLQALAGTVDLHRGRIHARGGVHFVPQLLAAKDVTAGSHGELRRRALAAAFASGATIVLLDEPTDDLDDEGVRWLRETLRTWTGCLVVATHDRRLLEDFRHFFVASESGCRYFDGTLDALDADLEREHIAAEQRYARDLSRLGAREAHTLLVGRRRDRKKRSGRCRELDRCTPTIRVNAKRGKAQVTHARLARLREARLDAVRDWTKSARRALGVHLSIELPMPSLSPEPIEVMSLRDVSVQIGERLLFGPLSLRLTRERVAIVGANGAGKSTLLDVMLGRRAPSSGHAHRDVARIGSIAQGASDWMLEESLAGYLEGHVGRDEVPTTLVAHKFPLALAERPLRSLSAGERTRAALIALFRRAPAVELIVLDEPTNGLDLLGQRALTLALQRWPGGLVVASHDRPFLDALRVERTIAITPR